MLSFTLLYIPLLHYCTFIVFLLLILTKLSLPLITQVFVIYSYTVTYTPPLHHSLLTLFPLVTPFTNPHRCAFTPAFSLTSASVLPRCGRCWRRARCRRWCWWCCPPRVCRWKSSSSRSSSTQPVPMTLSETRGAP